VRWMKIKPDEACAYSRCGEKLLYREIRNGNLRAAHVGAGRNLITCDLWLDEYLESRATPTLERPRLITGKTS
jgi:hypothetical protein